MPNLAERVAEYCDHFFEDAKFTFHPLEISPEDRITDSNLVTLFDRLDSLYQQYNQCEKRIKILEKISRTDAGRKVFSDEEYKAKFKQYRDERDQCQHEYRKTWKLIMFWYLGGDPMMMKLRSE